MNRLHLIVGVVMFKCNYICMWALRILNYKCNSLSISVFMHVMHMSLILLIR